MTTESDKLRKIKTDLKKIFENEFSYDITRPKMGPLEKMMEPGKWTSKLQELQWKMSDLAKDKTVDHLILYAEKNRNLNFGNTNLYLSSNNDRDHFEFEGTDGPIKFKGHIGPLNSIWLDVDNAKDRSELPKGYNWIARPSVIRIAPDVLTVWNPAGDSVIQETLTSTTKFISILENIANTALRTEKVDPEHPPFLRPRSFATESIFKKRKNKKLKETWSVTFSMKSKTTKRVDRELEQLCASAKKYGPIGKFKLKYAASHGDNTWDITEGILDGGKIIVACLNEKDVSWCHYDEYNDEVFKISRNNIEGAISDLKKYLGNAINAKKFVPLDDLIDLPDTSIT